MEMRGWSEWYLPYYIFKMEASLLWVLTGEADMIELVSSRLYLNVTLGKCDRPFKKKLSLRSIPLLSSFKNVSSYLKMKYAGSSWLPF